MRILLTLSLFFFLFFQVLQQIEEHGRGSQGAQRAAEELQQLAYRLASSDNITVVVIMFTPLDVHVTRR